ncbi:MAG: single-stranded DNA-binding protein [Bacteroidia bacterium]
MNKMTSENQVTITGHLGAAPVIKSLDSGKQVLRLSLANNTWVNGIRRTHWYTIVLWNELAAVAAAKIAKGDFVGFRGKLNTREFEGKDKTLYRITEILADQFWLETEQLPLAG